MTSTLARKGHLARTAAALVVTLVALLAPLVGTAGSPAAGAASLPSKNTWLRDVKAAMAGSHAYLDRRVAARAPGERLAIVLDIDNTAIATQYAWPRPTRTVRAFARHAVQKKVAVFFVTGRRSNDLGHVRDVLTRAGYRYVSICGRNAGENLPTSKQRCRRAITARGYTITANVGNRSTDLQGGRYERGFKLPSYGHALS